MSPSPLPSSTVGPILHAGPRADAVVAAIQEVDPQATTDDRGAYVRVLARSPLRVRRAQIAAMLGAPFHLPSDLEAIMPSFVGRIEMTSDEVAWTTEGP